MNSNDNRRGLGPIKGQHDCRRALDELVALSDQRDSLTHDERVYLDQLVDVIKAYREYCEEGSLKACPHAMLQYQLGVKSVDVTTAAAETGITDLELLITGQRSFTKDAAVQLAAYFGCPVDAFEY